MGGGFSRVHERKFLWSIQVCVCVCAEGIEIFLPLPQLLLLVSSNRKGVELVHDSTTFHFDSFDRFFFFRFWYESFLRNFDLTILPNDSKIDIFILINRYIRIKMIFKKKKNDLWPRDLNRAISARFRFRYQLERFLNSFWKREKEGEEGRNRRPGTTGRKCDSLYAQLTKGCLINNVAARRSHRIRSN